MPGNYSKVATVVTGQTITAAERNTEHDNHITYQTPAGTDDYSATVTEMRTETDPYPASVASQATSLAGELERIRYLMKQITGQTYWYIDPPFDMAAHVAGGDTHTIYRLEADNHTHQTTGLQAGTLDHGLAIIGLADDDHVQYSLLAGRATGQVLIGGTAAGDTLKLQSTSHATKGKVLFGLAGTTAYDDVNERIGIGTASPSARLHLYNGASLASTEANSGLVLEDDTHVYISFATPNTSEPQILFSDPESTIAGGISYDHAADSLAFRVSGTKRWSISTSGHLLAVADNTYDIGASGATRPRHAYIAGNLVVGGTATGVVQVITSLSQNLAYTTTPWTTTTTALRTFSSATYAAGDIIEIPWEAECVAGASTTFGLLSMSQSAGTAIMKLGSTSGSTLTTANFKIHGVSIPTTTGSWFSSSIVRIYCTGAGTATFTLNGGTVGGTASSSFIGASLRVLRQ